MARSSLIPVTGTIVQRIQAEVFSVCLPNGHELTGHVSAKMLGEVNRILPGVKVALQLTPHDLSRGRILEILE